MNTTATKLKYRADVDILRAIAVMSVVFYHFNYMFSMGYLGVDLFLVISGYLIFGQLYDKINERTFQFRYFYFRRIKRLLPALLFVVLLTYIVGYFFFAASDLRSLFLSGQTALLMFANIYFWASQDYFSKDAILQPLLHTWSLSLEEQFYLVAPPTFLICMKFFQKYLLHVLLFLALVSISLYFYGSVNDKSYAFYLIFTRSWGFLFGGVILLIEKKYSSSSNIYCKSIFTSLSIILFSIFIINNKEVFGGYEFLINLLVTLWGGLFLFIRIGSSANTFKPVLLVGQMSYSIYLAHFPIASFYFYNTGLLSSPIPLSLFCIFIICSLFLYFCIEKPLRYTNISPSYYMVTVGLALSLVLVLGYLGKNAKDFKRPIDTVYADYQPDNGKLIADTKKYMDQVENDVDFSDGSVLIIGNSFARDMYHLIYSGYPEIRDRLQFRAMTSIDKLIDPELFLNTKTLIVSQRYFEGDFEALEKLLKLEVIKNIKIGLILNPIEFPELSKRTLMDSIVSKTECDLTEYKCRNDVAADVNQIYSNYVNASESDRPIVKEVNQRLFELSKNHTNIELFSRSNIYCKENLCEVTNSSLSKAFFDYGHVTEYGIKYFGSLARKNGWMAEFLELKNEQ